MLTQNVHIDASGLLTNECHENRWMEDERIVRAEYHRPIACCITVCLRIDRQSQRLTS